MPWIEFGHLCAWLAFVLALVQATAPIVGRLTNRLQITELSVRVAPIMGLLVIAGAATLVNAFVTDDFSVAYVAQNSNSQLPLLYKVSALWGGMKDRSICG